jgi:hypothetical protein
MDLLRDGTNDGDVSMISKSGYEIVRFAEIGWEARVNVDGWPCRAGMYYNDTDTGLCLRLIDYPVGSVEPRHVHAGMHATTVLRGRAIVDGVTLGPLDVVLGPSNEPHGPLHYPDGCNLLSAFVGSYHHSESQQSSAPKSYRLVQSAQIAWASGPSGSETKTLIDHGCGPLRVHVIRFARGGRLEAAAALPTHAALVIEGEAVIEDESLRHWDFCYAKGGAPRGAIEFPNGATLLSWTLA